MKLPGLDVRWVKLLLLLIVLGVTGFMLANPAFMGNEYFGALAGLPVGCCLVLAVGAGDPAARARRQVLRQQREIRERSMMTLAEWDKKYGTPVVTPVQKSEPLPPSRYQEGHICDRKYYAFRSWCPVHGSGASPVVGADVSADEFARKVAKAAEESYVPEGYADLYQNLVETLRDQAAEGIKGSHWEMNAEWAAEVKKIKVTEQMPDGRMERGKSLWKPRTRVMPPGYPTDYLLGFPVRVSNEYGAPSLEAP
jgi:hypothetical protein